MEQQQTSSTAPPPGPGYSHAAFLDVQALLERSQPRGPVNWVGYGLGIFAFVVLLSAYLSAQSATMARVVQLASPIVMVGIIGGMMVWTSSLMQRRRGEMKQLEAIEELMTLRRWPEAAMLLEGLLGQPTRTPQARAQGLIFLTSVLARYHRFADAIAVQEHLLDHIRFDDGTDYALRLGRAMAMLREDHLVDADRAMSELKRLRQRDRAGAGDDETSDANGDVTRAQEATQAGTQGPNQAGAGLALVELYRDVKTGHPEEAVRVFDVNMEALRDQLGHRCGDAYALVAKAYDLLGRADQARIMYEKATALQPMGELERRYPEVASLQSKYQATVPPPEMVQAAGLQGGIA